MGALLKAIGTAIWSLIAAGFVIVLGLVAYQATLKYRSAIAPIADSPRNDFSSLDPPTALADSHREIATQSINEPLSGSKPTVLEAIRQRFAEAAQQHQFGAVLDTGNQLYIAGLTTPDDLLIIAHAFSSLGDCGNALIWNERAKDTLRSVGAEPPDRAGPAGLPCTHRVPIQNAATLARSGNTALANRFVGLGEAYYGFGDYEQAITALQRGLDIGGSSHLTDAYVYLGRSQLMLNNKEAACRAFASLRDVPEVSPRILRLWELYVDMHC